MGNGSLHISIKTHVYVLTVEYEPSPIIFPNLKSSGFLFGIGAWEGVGAVWLGVTGVGVVGGVAWSPPPACRKIHNV